MGNRATFVIAGPEGHERRSSSFGAVGLDLDLLGVPEAVLPFVLGHRLEEGPWYDDGMCEAGALIDPARKLLLAFAQEGPSVAMRTRAAWRGMLGHAWPGWKVRWTYDGQSGLRAHLGLDPGHVPGTVHPGPALEADEEELADPDPLAAVVTVGSGRCHVLAHIADHPVAEGPALVGRLADAPAHTGYAGRAEAGVHVDPAARRVGWWLTGIVPHAGCMAARWPGWTVEFWADRWDEHERASDGRFAPPAQDRAAALADVRAQALQRWAGPRGDVRERLVAALPHATIGRGFAPAVTAERAAAARAAVELAHAAAVAT
ncbi:hypothetical protein [Streptomyces sp. H021]|uniref:hypothetical protein n=1 Tax=Streptomyces sp. H021 TaxID=1519486 RepID=UPI0006AFD5C1|nr:hypothetical protein [Streptomyces sp. H021]KOV44395.1 hypothetical protein ADK97_05185 [Streptomyces sp. H021]